MAQTTWHGFPLTKLPLDASCRGEIESASGLRMQYVSQRGLYPRGLCYWNVDRLVRDHGGSMVLGWQHLWWPDRLAISMHHAIWKKPDGTLVDVTQKENSDRAEGITFSADPSLGVELAWPMFVPNVFCALSDNEAVGKAVAAFQAQIEAARQACEYVKAREGSFEPGHGLRLRAGSMPKALSQNIQRTSKQYRLAIDQCRELGL